MSLAEPSFEPQGTAEAEAEAEATVGAEAEAEALGEMAAEGEGLGEAETFGEAEGTQEPVAESEVGGTPGLLDLLLPACLLIFAILVATCLISYIKTAKAKRKRHKKLFSPSMSHLAVSPLPETKSRCSTDSFTTATTYISGSPDGSRNPSAKGRPEGVLLLTGQDEAIIGALQLYPYELRHLLALATPALLSLAFMPVALLLHGDLVRFFWPPEIFDPPPKINDVISCFLIPAGLVYAIAFGFAFQEASNQQVSYRKWLTSYATSVKQILMMLSRIRNVSAEKKMSIIRRMKVSYIDCCLTIMKRDKLGSKLTDPLVEMQITLFDIKDAMERSTRPGIARDLHLCDRLLDLSLGLHQHAADLSTLRSNMNVFQWAFLETLGYFSFFGILLVSADSYRLELIMCLVTVLTISMFSYVLSDLDRPFHGVFSVDLSSIFETRTILAATADDVLKAAASSDAEESTADFGSCASRMEVLSADVELPGNL